MGIDDVISLKGKQLKNGGRWQITENGR